MNFVEVDWIEMYFIDWLDWIGMKGFEIDYLNLVD